MQKFAPETKKPVPAEFDLGAYRIADPEAFGRNMLRLMEEGQKVMARASSSGPMAWPARTARPAR